MKVLQINTVFPNGSTGKIVNGIYGKCKEKNISCKIAYSYSKNKKEQLNDTIEVSNWLDTHIHNRLARMTMLIGYFSFFRTLKLIRYLNKHYMPDVVHLHNLHGNYINIPLLFHYLKKKSIPVVWTLHDCWSFTGYCSYYSLDGCNKWMTCCYDCPQKGRDKVNIIDTSKFVFKHKKSIFTSVEELTLVTPSQWINGMVKESFLKEKKSIVIRNGIDTSIFKPCTGSFRGKHHITDEKFMVLAVSFDWNARKGLDVVIELSKRLADDFCIVMVGTNREIDEIIPKNIISVHRTENQKELAEIYSSADIFINPTREEMFGMVNIESLACGTPVVTFDSGGSPECIDETCGIVVPYNNVDAMEKAILEVYNRRQFSNINCVEKAKKYDQDNVFSEYIELYEKAYHLGKDKRERTDEK